MRKSRTQSVIIVTQNLWLGIYVNGKLIHKIGPADSVIPLEILIKTIEATNVKLIKAKTAWQKDIPMLPDDLTLITNLELGE